MLTAKVVAVESAERFTDQKPRVVLRFSEADTQHNELRLHANGERLDDTVTFATVYGDPVAPVVPAMTQSQAMALLEAAYPKSSINIEATSWSNYYDFTSPETRGRRVEWMVGVQPGPATECDQYRGKTIAEAVNAALDAAKAKPETIQAEADVLMADFAAVDPGPDVVQGLAGHPAVSIASDHF